MYGIFTYIWFMLMLNVGTYTTHGSYGFCFSSIPGHRVMSSESDWGVQSPSWNSRFHYNSQAVIGSLGFEENPNGSQSFCKPNTLNRN